MKTLAYFRPALAAILFVSACSFGKAADVPAVAIRDGGAAVDVTGLPADALDALSHVDWKPDEWAALFALYVEPADGSDPTQRPPVLGAYRVADGALRFTPRFPLRAAFLTGRSTIPTESPADKRDKAPL